MSTCRWCTPQGKSTIEFLHSYSSEELPPEELKAANEDLCYCLECVVDYHQARDELPLAHKNLWKIESKRLIEHFEKALKDEQEEDDELFLIEDEQEIQLPGYTGPDFENNLRVPILEILKYPYLLLHEHLSDLYVEALSKMEQVNFSFQTFEKYPGIYLLLVHPNETIRRWAILAARSLGKVERDDFYDLQEVITCLLKVIELDLFENTDFYNSYGIEEGKLILLPPHLYDVTNHKNYWLGICMLLMVLDEQAMDSLLLAQDKQNDFMKSILNTMMKCKPDDASDPFWPALQCFMVILDRLGSKVWGQLIDPTEAFQTIIRSQSYNNEIDKIRNTRNNAKIKCDLDDDDDMVSCSQIVYDYNSKKTNKDAGWRNAICPDYYPNMYDEMQSLVNVLQCDIGQDMRVHNSTFLWFIPFVNSVMDLKDLGIAYIGEVVYHIYSEIKDILNRKVDFCDKVSEFFILILVSIIELHRNKNHFHLLWYSSQRWVEALVKCATLPARVFNQNSEKATAASNVKVTSSSLAAGSSAACSSITSSVQQACVQLIRSFLREGCQSQQRNMFQQFLDKLNRQLRSTFILGWQLSPKEQQELQSCLTQLVKSAKNKLSDVKQLSSTVGRGSGLKLPSIKSEQEEPGEWGKMPEYYNSGPGPPSPLMLQLDSKSSAIQQGILNQEKIADCKTLECRAKESFAEPVLPFKAEFTLYDDNTFHNKHRIDDDDVFETNNEQELLRTRMTIVEISPPPSPCHSLENVTVGDPQSRHVHTLQQTAAPTHESSSNVDLTASPLHKDNLPAETLEVARSVPRKEKWKRSMLLEFQESMSKGTAKPEAVATEKDQHVQSPVPSTCDAIATDCDLPTKVESVNPGPSKFKIDPNKLFNLKVKMQAINLEEKMLKESNSSPRKGKSFEKLPDTGVDRQLDNMNSSNTSQNLTFSGKNKNDNNANNLLSSHLQTATLSPLFDKREKPQSSGHFLSPLSSVDRAPGNVSQSPRLPNPFDCWSNSSDSDDDDIPFSELRVKLKKRVSLTSEVNANDSNVNQDLVKPLLAASVVSANLFRDFPQELSQSEIDKKERIACQVQLCDSIHNKKKCESDSSLEGPTVVKNAEVATISHSESSKETTNSDVVHKSEAGKKDTATFVQDVSGAIEQNKPCLQEMPTYNKSPPAFEENDSQFFEFESEEQVYSVWQDTLPQKRQVVDKEKAGQVEFRVQPDSDEIEVNSMLNEWGYDTDYVSDELIEKVVEEAEAHLKKGHEEVAVSGPDTEKQFTLGLKWFSSSSSSTDEDVSVGSSNVSHPGFISDTSSKHKNEQEICSKKIIDPNCLRSLIRSGKSKRKLAPTKKSPDSHMENVLPVKNRTDKGGDRSKLGLSKGGVRGKHLSQATWRKDSNRLTLNKQNSCHQKTLIQKKPTKHLERKGSLTSLTNVSKSAARDVQKEFPSTSTSVKLHYSSSPKKVRKRPEPTSTVEKLGLKKKIRKAFDLSQGSLDNLNKLRNYGQTMGPIEHCKKAKLITPQKLTTRTNPRLLVSQDLQYLRQCKLQECSKGKKRKSKSTPDGSTLPKRSLSNEESWDSLATCAQKCQKHLSNVMEKSNDCVAATTSLGKEHSRAMDMTSSKEKLSSINAIDDLNLTQNDVLEIDISTDENLEDDEFLMLTQRDPIDGDTTEEENSRKKPSSPNETRCQYTGCTDVIVSSEKFCKKHTLPEPKDDTFVKPGLPLSIPKSSRPATAKLFASSTTSRNAQLATELEVVPKCPGGAASKVQKPSLPTFAVPVKSRPTPVAKDVGTTNVLRTLNKDANFGTRSSFPTPVTALTSSFPPLPPGRSRQVSPNINLGLTEQQHRDQSYLINAILKWSYQMFDSFDQFGAPDSLCEFTPREVPERFQSYEEYFHTFYPLLMLNLFEQLAQKLKESKQANKMVQNSLTLKNYRVEGQINCAEFQVFLRDYEFERQLHPKEDDVVFLWLPHNQNNYMQEEAEMMMNNPIPCISHISRTSRFSAGRDSQTALYLTIRTRGNVSAVKNQPVRCAVIGSLVTTIRQFKGLLFLAKTPLIRPILSASFTYFTQRDLVESPKLSHADDYNEYQQKAINVAYAMVKQPRIPKVCLIQGPPGTGKSKTIVGFLHRLLNEEQENVKPYDSRNIRTKRTRILVCAPSNAAIDDLMKKIIVDFKSKCKDKNNALGNCGDVNLVRLGTEKAINSDVTKFSLDYQVNHRLKKCQSDADQSNQRRKDWLDRRLDELGKKCAIIKKDKEKSELVTQERRTLEREREELGRRLKEAGQACETEILIPLIFRCPKLVLVGDCEQLPPTIISMKAREFSYGQSMMCRLQKCLQDEVKQNICGRNPVMMLLTQYRMHPDICLFPSKYIYGSLLKTDEKVEMQRCSPSWPFQSYMLFDVTDGYEYRERDSYFNTQEVKLVIALISMIAEKQKGNFRNIGVITPYNAQKQKIIRQIQQEFKQVGQEQGRSLHVGTVDGFQGSEKDCIIVTCVRASNLQGTIGFLADRQRMNVTITRARLSLFILGNLKTLMESKDWNALIQDAQKRGAIVKTCESEYKKDCQKIMKPRPAFQRNISDPSALISEQKRVPSLDRKSSWNEGVNFKTAMHQVADPSSGQFQKAAIPSQQAASLLHNLHRAIASVGVKPQISATIAQPPTSVRSESSAQSKLRDPRLARRALLKGTQPQLQANQTPSEARVVNPPDSSASISGHGAPHSSHFCQSTGNTLSRAGDDEPNTSTSNRSLVFPSGIPVCRNYKETVYGLDGSRRQTPEEKEKEDMYGEQKQRWK
ncbi:probable helicase senataxin isoform X2 [Scyliorhinus torazame]|uniref:probable helicase senataxin isoform X2 n=1 Tax=Scyliorhinus torazame TaxID=75743 RepID=UPI003B5CE9CD